MGQDTIVALLFGAGRGLKHEFYEAVKRAKAIALLFGAGRGLKHVNRVIIQCYRSRLLMGICAGWLKAISEDERARVTAADGAIIGGDCGITGR